MISLRLTGHGKYAAKFAEHLRGFALAKHLIAALTNDETGRPPVLSLDGIFALHRVMVIHRGMPSPGSAVDAAQRAWDAGVELVEVPIGQAGDTATWPLSSMPAEAGARWSAQEPSSRPSASRTRTPPELATRLPLASTRA